MSPNKQLLTTDTVVEFSPGKDPFVKARRKGPTRWILAHIFQGPNRLFILIIILTIIIAANLSSIIYIIIGDALSVLLSGSTALLGSYILIILLIGIVGPLLRILSRLLVETLAQRIERDARKEFFTNLLGKSQSFHDRQKIGDLMARVTNDVRTLNFLISPALSLVIESFTFLFIPIIYIILRYPIQLIIEPIIFSISFLLLLRSYSRNIGPVSNELREKFGSITDILSETLSGIEVVKGTVQEENEMKKYITQAIKYKDAFIKRGK
ncbi:MAG: ABC transporter transmembrane domain-containing protein, partial [Candidatus Hermodarchaeota archaeon]